MKNFILALVLTGFMTTTHHLYSQSEAYEFGLRLEGIENFQDFDFVYKYSLKKENKFVRYRLVAFGVRGSTDTATDHFELNFGVGWENRKPATAKFQFAHGVDLGLDLSIDFSSLLNEETGFRFQVGYMLGVQYRISEEFCIGLETIPNFSVLLSQSARYNLNIGLDNPEALALTFVYVFNKDNSRILDKKRRV